MCFGAPHPHIYLWLDDDRFRAITPRLRQCNIQLSLKFGWAHVRSGSFVIHDQRSVREAGLHNFQHLRASASHTTITALLNQNLKVDRPDTERLMAPKRAADRVFRILVWNKQDQIAHRAGT